MKILTRTALVGVVAFVFAAAAGAVPLAVLELIAANSPPPPYTSGQVNQATANALGGVASEMACNENVTTVADMLSTARWATASGCSSASLTTANAVQGRVYTVKLLTAGAAHSRVCVGLGATTPVAGCSDVNVAGDGLGCSLVNAGDVCQRVIRPQTTGCTSWDTCHLPLWALESASGGAGVEVEVTVSQ